MLNLWGKQAPTEAEGDQPSRHLVPEGETAEAYGRVSSAHGCARAPGLWRSLLALVGFLGL